MRGHERYTHLKVIHLPTSVGGMSWGLAQGERALGLESNVLVVSDNWLQYPADRFLFKNAQNSLWSKMLRLAILMKEVYRIRKRYDVFHFNYGTSLIDLWKIGLPLLDLPFYKKGKVVMTFNGCDARQKYPTLKRNDSSACHDDLCYHGICKDGKLDKKKEKRIHKLDRYADAIFAVNPDLFYFLPEQTKFLPYTIGAWNQIGVTPLRDLRKGLKILHSPTDRGAKGSKIIIQTLQKIKKQYGERVEIILVENISNRQALQIYSEVDLAIDQILIGWYGGFAVEMMKMGKPVMAFIREGDLKYIPKEMAEECLQTIINITPNSLYERVCFLMENPEILKRYREAGLDYVHRWHNPAYVAGITKAAYES